MGTFFALKSPPLKVQPVSSMAHLQSWWFSHNKAYKIVQTTFLYLSYTITHTNIALYHTKANQLKKPLTSLWLPPYFPFVGLPPQGWRSSHKCHSCNERPGREESHQLIFSLLLSFFFFLISSIPVSIYALFILQYSISKGFNQAVKNSLTDIQYSAWIHANWSPEKKIICTSFSLFRSDISPYSENVVVIDICLMTFIG